MFRRDVFVLIAAVLVGGVTTVYASLADKPFFPASLQTTIGECPENGEIPAHRRPILGPDEASWFGSQLRTLHEEPLSQRSAGQRLALRLSLLSGPTNTAVRVEKAEDGRFHLTGKWLNPCAEERGCVVEKVLSPAEQARLEAVVEPLLNTQSYGCDGRVDSSPILMEISNSGAYRLWLERSSPSSDLGAVGTMLLQLAEWPLAGELATAIDDSDHS